ncbi:F390 synthetase-related protein [Polaromonas sp. YR568]|uniref:F390 synthetase-related protein n=1 Tax=Polaromonas sp. YR568 TaxID=1855301 RepID=UPI00398BD951
MKRLFWLLLAYWQTRRLHFADRAVLRAYQARQLEKFTRKLCRRSVYFAPYRRLPLDRWPSMDKASMLANFDTMNTAGLTLDNVMAEAQAAERSRDFTPTVAGITVGLSSGTSAQRGAFAVSDREKARWAGILLAKALPDGLLAGERAALFLRANSNLYTAVRSRWLSLRFFDLFLPFETHIAALQAYRPTIIVAPAQVLRELAVAVLAGRLALHPRPKRVISVAEVLEPQDRALIERAFGPMHQVYQATEGFLASTCEHGVLHLNEEFVHIEPEWLDGDQRRFVPVITDFSRLTQPIVRYRLGDVLAARATPCACGRVTRAIDHIEGRCDDMLHLPGADGKPMPVFADALSRALAQSLPADADYRLLQTGASSLTLHAQLTAPALQAVRAHLNAALAQLGVATSALSWTLSRDVPAFDPTQKRRRIRKLAFEGGGHA